MCDDIVNHINLQGPLVVLRSCAGPWKSHPATSWARICSGLLERPNVSPLCIRHLQKSVCELIVAGGICCEKCILSFICSKTLRWTGSTLVIFPAGLMKRLCIMLCPWLQERILGPPSTTSSVGGGPWFESAGETERAQTQHKAEMCACTCPHHY